MSSETDANGVYECKHCGMLAQGARHIEGNQAYMMRCDPADTGLPYGYNAEPADQDCGMTCLGS